MTDLEFPVAVLDQLSDVELGKTLLGHFIAAEASARGFPIFPIDEIPLRFAEHVVIKVRDQESDRASDAALEKSLHKAAKGEFEDAGRFFREYLLLGAQAEKYIPIGRRRSAQMAEFGRLGAAAVKQAGQTTRVRVLAAAKDILSSRSTRPSDRQLAELIARSSGLNIHTVRQSLGKLRKEKLLD